MVCEPRVAHSSCYKTVVGIEVRISSRAHPLRGLPRGDHGLPYLHPAKLRRGLLPADGGDWAQ